MSYGRYSFSFVGEIKKAYQDAFYCDFPSVDDLIHDDMRLLENARNLLVHRGGRIDAKFLKEVGSAEAFGELKLGEDLFVSGHLAKRFIEATLKSGIALFRAVDDWLEAHLYSPEDCAG